MRINQYISASGFCSRREADAYILAKKVKINGKVADIGTRVGDSDRVEVNGKKIIPKKKHITLALNKPVGITCTTERHVKGNIIDFINYPERIFPIGRLDKDSEGLLLMTNDGDLIHKLMKGSNNHEKEYMVKVTKELPQDFKEKMEAGIFIKELKQKTRPCEVEVLGKFTFRIVITQGLNRQIRRMCEALELRVNVLQRVRVANIKIGKLRPGTFRRITGDELEELYSLVEGE